MTDQYAFLEIHLQFCAKHVDNIVRVTMYNEMASAHGSEYYRIYLHYEYKKVVSYWWTNAENFISFDFNNHSYQFVRGFQDCLIAALSAIVPCVVKKEYEINFLKCEKCRRHVHNPDIIGIDALFLCDKCKQHQIDIEEKFEWYEHMANKYLEMMKSQERKDSDIVYIAKMHEINKYKIGITSNIKNRISQLLTSSPNKIEFLHHARVENARSTEAYLHEKFGNKRLNGEWFDLDESELNYAIETINSEKVE